jgi:hypothetical protein
MPSIRGWFRHHCSGTPGLGPCGLALVVGFVAYRHTILSHTPADGPRYVLWGLSGYGFQTSA